jgi:hypothetical protein
MAFDTADRSRDPSRIEPISPGQRRSPAESLPIGRHYPLAPVSPRRMGAAGWRLAEADFCTGAIVR